jgi:hypothetical protein
MELKDILIIEHIKGYCDDITEILSSVDNDYSIYQSSIAAKYAIGMCFLQIGELTPKL